MKKPLLIIFLVLLIDQCIKIYIKTHFALDEEYRIAPWFILHFTENPGMAFGMQLGGSYGKILLSIFRIAAVVAIGWYLRDIVNKKMHPWLIVSVALIFAGALGNIIDSAFYGLIFNSSGCVPAQLFPAGGGYAGFLHGKVVDMFYFPLIHGQFPSWFPFWGGQDYIFFRPIFNFSDSSITVGVILILLFQRKFYPKKTQEAPTGIAQAANGEEASPSQPS